MAKDKKGNWQGGNTFTNKYDKLIRESEDYYDEMDSESTTRDSLKEKYKKYPPKKDIKMPRVNDFSKKTKVTGMGGVQRKMGYSEQPYTCESDASEVEQPKVEE